MDGIESLCDYDRITLCLWRRASAELDPLLTELCPTWAAVHAVLVGLRRHADATALLAAYESRHDNEADLALIGSLLPGVESHPRYFQIREAAFHLRWREVVGVA